MDIYDELIEKIEKEGNLEELLTKEDKWEYLYNFSNIRKNLLEWYDFKSDASLLEIGAECGALTSLFCERVKEVVALEEDERKCKVNSARNKNYTNLRIVKTDYSNLNSLDVDTYDYVTVLGNLSAETIRFAVSKVKKGGKIIIAFDNKYGVKNWGSVFDKDGQFKSNIPGSSSNDSLVLTKESVEEFLKKEGIKEVSCYYPIPDYILPLEIYNEDSIPKSNILAAPSPSYIHEKIMFVDEVKAINEIIEDGLFDKYANSFLLICG